MTSRSSFSKPPTADGIRRRKGGWMVKLDLVEVPHRRRKPTREAIGSVAEVEEGDRPDSNRRHPGPQPGALTRLSYGRHGPPSVAAEDRIPPSPALRRWVYKQPRAVTPVSRGLGTSPGLSEDFLRPDAGMKRGRDCGATGGPGRSRPRVSGNFPQSEAVKAAPSICCAIADKLCPGSLISVAVPVCRPGSSRGPA
jgi:hypothetical protein